MKKDMVLPLVLCLVLLASAAIPGKAQEKMPARMKPALVVIDIQNAYLPYMAEEDKKMGLEMINAAIALFRERGLTVVRVYHTDLQYGPKPGSPEFEFPATVAVKEEDAKIIKNFANAFKKTELDNLLRSKGINTLFLCGLSSVGCVLATFRGADDLDYRVFMVKDALIGPRAAYTDMVEEICESVGYGALKLLLDNIQK